MASPLNSFKVPSYYSFTGNPMIAEVSSFSKNEIRLTVIVQDFPSVVLAASPYKMDNSNLYYAEFDIADILKTYFKDITIQEGQIIGSLSDFMILYELRLEIGSLIVYQGVRGYVINGGINSRNLKFLSVLNTNMFDYRLNNHKNQFLFTTRTNSKQLRLRQSELYPFIFINTGKTLTFVTSGGKMIVPEIPSSNICSLDINALRKMFFDLYQVLPSYFAVMVDNEFSFDITLLPGQLSEDKYFLLFKNSLGGYEKIEVAGKGYDTIEFQEEDQWKSMNEVNVMEDHRSRLFSKSGMSVEVGYKDKEELNFLLDLIKSDEVYFIDSSSPVGVFPERCLINIDKFNVPRKITSPQSIVLKLAFVYEDQFESPRIIFETDKNVFENITQAGAPEWNGDGFIYDDDYMLYAE